MRALVTGGGGFLGHYIVERLLARGDEVLVLARGEYPELKALGAGLIRGDLSERETVTAACSGVDVVFHVASLVKLFGRWCDFYRTNVLGTENVIFGCAACGVPRLVYTSTPSVVFDGRDLLGVDESCPYAARYTSPYPASKAMAEKLVLAANGKNGLCTVALRPHLIWGPRDTHIIPSIIERARSGKLRVIGSGTNVVDFTYVENVADAHLLAADHLCPGSAVSGKCYFISQDQPIPLWEFVKRVLAVYGLGLPERKISYPLACFFGTALEVLYRALPLSGEPRLTRFLAAELARSHHFSSARARRDFGYFPRVSMDEGLGRLAAGIAPLSSSLLQSPKQGNAG